MTRLAAFRALPLVALPLFSGCAMNAFSEEARLDCLAKNTLVISWLREPPCPPTAMCHPQVVDSRRAAGFEDFFKANSDGFTQKAINRHIEKLKVSDWWKIPLKEAERDAEYCRSRFS